MHLKRVHIAKKLSFRDAIMTQFNVASFLSERALTDPNAPAVCFVKERSLIEKFFSVFSFTNSKRNPEYDQLSFLELDQSVNALVHNLSQRGVKAGMRTLLMVKPGLDLIQIVFALFKIGAVPVVIDPGMGIARFFQCAKQSKVEWVLGKPLAIGLARWFFSGLDNNKLISTGRNFARAIRTELGKHSYSARSVEADTLAAVLFTSGSTGAAKGVRYTHGMFYAQVQLIREAYSIEAGEVDLPMLAVFALFNPALGMCTVVPEMNPSRPAQVKPRKIVDSIDRFQVTNSFGSPTLWKLVTDYCEREGRQLPSLKRVIMAGAPAPQNLLTRLQRLLPKGEIFTPYGATEALPVSSISAREIFKKQVGAFAQGRRGICVGYALPGVSIRVVEFFQLEEGELPRIESIVSAQAGTIGEIIVSGPSVTQAYDYLPEATADSKIKDEGFYWHRMGDMGWLDAEGCLWFCGRKAERVWTERGFLETVCCEAIFNQLEGVARSALIDLGDGQAGVVIEPKRDCYPKTENEREHFRVRLRKQAASDVQTEMIREFFFEKHFPVDVRHNAKIHRLALAKKFRLRKTNKKKLDS